MRRYTFHIVAGTSLVLLAAGAGVSLLPLSSDVSTAQDGAHAIVLGENGFVPEQSTVAPGDTVVFRNESTEPFWPASDAHPAHTYYPGSGIEQCGEGDEGLFDACRPLDPGLEWSFTFTEEGIWRYHNHLNPTHVGTVVVGEGKDLVEAEIEQYCQNPDSSECFDAQVRKAVKEKGIEAGYALLIEEFEGAERSPNCHWTAHIIGGAAYELFQEGQDVPISEATSYCGYGFYHEFFEHALRENPDPDFALSFCDRVEAALGKMGLWNCYHGIGHGYSQDPPPPHTIGNFDAMVASGIEICERLFAGHEFRDLNLCLTGVFTVPAEFAEHGEYGLFIDSADPFLYCKDQPYRYKKACYGELAPKLGEIMHWDLSLLPSYVEELGDPKLERLVTWVVPSVLVARVVSGDADIESYITACQNEFDGGMERICVGGLVLGFILHGQPGKQYESHLDMCASPNLTEENRALCYSEMVRQLRLQVYNEYSEEEFEGICDAIPPSYRQYCKDPLRAPYDDPSFEEA